MVYQNADESNCCRRESGETTYKTYPYHLDPLTPHSDLSLVMRKQFLCNCSAYHNERQLFFKYIVDSASSFRTLDDSAKLIWLMTCEDGIVINALADFVYKCFEMRKCAIT